MTIDQFIAERLVPMRGEFEVNGKGEIRHKTLTDLRREPCCPAAACQPENYRDNTRPFTVIAKDIEFNDRRRFIYAADNMGNPALRSRILEALGLEERKI